MWDLFCLVPVGGQDYRVPLLFSKRALGFLWVFLALKNSKLAFFVWLCFFFWVGFWQGVWVSEQTPLPILSETPSAKSSRHFFRFRFSYWKVWTRVQVWSSWLLEFFLLLRCRALPAYVLFPCLDCSNVCEIFSNFVFSCLFFCVWIWKFLFLYFSRDLGEMSDWYNSFSGL